MLVSRSPSYIQLPSAGALHCVPRLKVRRQGAGKEVPGPHTHNLQDQCCLVLHVLNANCHLVGARVGAAGSSDEQDCVCGAVSDAHLLTRQWLPLFGPSHLRPGFALGEVEQPNSELDSLQGLALYQLLVDRGCSPQEILQLWFLLWDREGVGLPGKG